ncbi:MAG: glutamate racemase [Ancalomicrobiaceae bacterium]|nr:glutamate racemase [Ancalomicrobiaceae bacterium]
MSAPPSISPGPTAPAAEPAPHILVFDSGIGGLSVLAEIRKRLPLAAVTYVADDAAFPYGAWDGPALTAHVDALMADLIAGLSPDVVVIACNTASTLVLPTLRARHALPFVGTVPAIKPAAQATKSGLISVIATPGTVERDYTRALIDAFAGNCAVTLVGSAHLAEIAERHLRGVPVDDGEIAAEIAPCFVTDGQKRTDAIVLGCTHYPFLIERFRRLAPWQVTWIDPAPAIARRVAAVMPAVMPQADRAAEAMLPGRAIFTSGRPVPPALRQVLNGFGLGTGTHTVAGPVLS